MSKITPHLWYDTQAVEAAELYVSTFPGSEIRSVKTLPGTPSGDTDVVAFELFGQPFMSISAGPLFRFNPSVSFLVACETKDEVDRYWKLLSDGGQALMPLSEYSFSEWFGWTEDRFGLSWQVMHNGEREITQRIAPTLMFVGENCGKAEEAIEHYTNTFPDSKVEGVMRYGPGEEPDAEGTVKHAGFSLSGYEMGAMDSALAHDYQFNESVSLMVSCEDQQEIDRYWDALSAVPEAEQCGWIKDRYGLSWQITPAAMGEMMEKGTPDQIARVTEAFLPMKKFDLAGLERAFQGS